jgi:hypothetical protein
MRGSGRSLSCEGGQRHRVDDRKMIAVKHVTVYYLLSFLDDFSLNSSSFTNSQLLHEFTTFARIHNFRTNSRFLYEFLCRVFRISRLSNEFTTFTRFHNSHDLGNKVSQTNGFTRTPHLDPRAWYWGDAQNTRLLELIVSGDINPNTTDRNALYNYTVTYFNGFQGEEGATRRVTRAEK